MITDLKLFAYRILGIIGVLFGVVLMFGNVILGFIVLIIASFLWFKSNKSRIVLMN